MDTGELEAKAKELERREQELRLKEAELRQKPESLDHVTSISSKDSEKSQNTVRTKGIKKFFAGMIALALSPVLHIASIVPLAASAACFVGSACAKGMSMISSSPEDKEKWLERSQNLRSVGTKALIAGALMATPFALGATLMAEGVYNGVTGEDKLGITPTMRFAARHISGGLPQHGDPGHNPTKIWQRSNLQASPQAAEIELTPSKRPIISADINRNSIASERDSSIINIDSSTSIARTSQPKKEVGLPTPKPKGKTTHREAEEMRASFKSNDSHSLSFSSFRRSSSSRSSSIGKRTNNL